MLTNFTSEMAVLKGTLGWGCMKVTQALPLNSCAKLRSSASGPVSRDGVSHQG